MDSTFDVVAFANSSIDAPMDTKTVPIPVAEYNGIATKLDFKSPKDRMILEVTWKIDDTDGRAQAATGRDVNTSRQAIFLDMTPQGALDVSKGKNIQLGKLREALGMNVPGRPFKFGDIVGQPAKIKIGHTDPNDNGDVYDKVTSVSKL